LEKQLAKLDRNDVPVYIFHMNNSISTNCTMNWPKCPTRS